MDRSSSYAVHAPIRPLPVTSASLPSLPAIEPEPSLALPQFILLASQIQQALITLSSGNRTAAAAATEIARAEVPHVRLSLIGHACPGYPASHVPWGFQTPIDSLGLHWLSLVTVLRVHNGHYAPLLRTWVDDLLITITPQIVSRSSAYCTRRSHNQRCAGLVSRDWLRCHAPSHSFFGRTSLPSDNRQIKNTLLVTLSSS